MKTNLNYYDRNASDLSYQLPVIDISALCAENKDLSKAMIVAEEIGIACKEYGFFYISGHGIALDLEQKLEQVAKDFFALPLEIKQELSLNLGGKAWRGWFPLGQELTSGLPDQKEGIYLGVDLSSSHDEVIQQTPFYGSNLCPNEEFRITVTDWMKEMRRVGDALIQGIALSLGLECDHFDRHGLSDPLQLFRIFHYPPSSEDEQWGVGEHTDYGVLTILKQDQQGGLQIKKRDKSSDFWIDAPPISGTFVVNIGDMLEKMTVGHYVSTPHRVKNRSKHARLSFPYFFDPNYFAELSIIENLSPPKVQAQVRWDHANVHKIKGTYGEYLLSKVSKVFPKLFDQVQEK